jgi:hypothetical protein
MKAAKNIGDGPLKCDMRGVGKGIVRSWLSRKALLPANRHLSPVSISETIHEPSIRPPKKRLGLMSGTEFAVLANSITGKRHITWQRE